MLCRTLARTPAVGPGRAGARSLAARWEHVTDEAKVTDVKGGTCRSCALPKSGESVLRHAADLFDCTSLGA